MRAIDVLASEEQAKCLVNECDEWDRYLGKKEIERVEKNCSAFSQCSSSLLLTILVIDCCIANSFKTKWNVVLNEFKQQKCFNWRDPWSQGLSQDYSQGADPGCGFIWNLNWERIFFQALTWWLPRFSSLQAVTFKSLNSSLPVDLRLPSVLCHISFLIMQLTTWHLPSSEKKDKEQDGSHSLL